MFSADLGVTPSSTLYAEDVFSTYLYTGNGASLAINNGIDLAGKGGVVWIKDRASSTSHAVFNPSRLTPNTNNSQDGTAVLNFTSSGFSFTGSNTLSNNFLNANTNGVSYTSWTFREAPKFFDVVTYTGDGTSLRGINHSLGVIPGLVIVKATSTTANWFVAARTNAGTYHRTDGNGNGALNASTVFDTSGPFDFSSFSYVSNTAFTPQVVAGGTVANGNASGVSYIAYLFAHDPSATGLIQCGSFTTDASGNASVTSLGWEPQFLLAKAASTTGDWIMLDSMRGWNMTANDALLRANLSNAETTTTEYGNPTATGFDFKGGAASATYVYMAIRRPNKPPTSANTIFELQASYAATGSSSTSGISDLMISKIRTNSGGWYFADSLRGIRTSGANIVYSNSTAAETFVAHTTGDGYGTPGISLFSDNGGFHVSAGSLDNLVFYRFKRAPGFFDVVCYAGNGLAQQVVYHNLGVAPELVIIKARTSVQNWLVQLRSPVYLFDGVNGGGGALNNNLGGASGISAVSSATSSTFTLAGNSGTHNNASTTYVAYLFASLPGISKIGTYTGNGSTQTINCGFAAGARFVLIKRTDAAGDWYVVDTARGIVAAEDPRLLLNSTAAEVTTDDSVDPVSSGFAVNQLAATNINVSSATYLYLAIA